MFIIPSFKHTNPIRCSTPCLQLMLILILANLANTQQTIQTTILVTATPTSPHPPSYTSPEVFRDTILSSSNTYRKEHNASDLVWNETLTRYAKDWAEGCKWKHSVRPTFLLYLSVCLFCVIFLVEMLYRGSGSSERVRCTYAKDIYIARSIWREPRLRIPECLNRGLRMG